MKFDVIGIGTPLIDLLVKTEQKTLDQLGVQKGGMFLFSDEKMEKAYSSVENKIIKTLPGDSTANTIVGIAGLGLNTAYIGKVGHDDLGDMFINSLTDKGVISRIKKCDIPSGKVIALITPDSERTMLVNLGAAKELILEDVDPDDIKNSKWLHLTGYQLEPPKLKKSSLFAIEIAKKHKVKLSIDLADFNLVKRNMDLIEKVVGKADLVFANEDEVKAFTGKEPREALDEISKCCPIAVVKIGSKGSMIKTKDKIFNIPAYTVKAVDTTGAGDMYAAGVLYGLCMNLGFDRAGKIGAFAASKVVEQIGARLDYSLKDKIDDLP